MQNILNATEGKNLSNITDMCNQVTSSRKFLYKEQFRNKK